MNKDFEFKQLLRAYRKGIISEGAFEAEMKHLENGAGSSNGAGAFKAFGRSYDSERAAVVSFLEAVSAAETNGGDTVRAEYHEPRDCARSPRHAEYTGQQADHPRWTGHADGQSAARVLGASPAGPRAAVPGR